METYNLMQNCENCGQQNSLNIPKGITKTVFLETPKDCTTCGCPIVTQVVEPL